MLHPFLLQKVCNCYFKKFTSALYTFCWAWVLPHGGGVPRAGVLYPGTSGHHHSQVWATYSPTNTQGIYICWLEAGSNANTMLKFLVQSELLNNNIMNCQLYVLWSAHLQCQSRKLYILSMQLSGKWTISQLNHSMLKKRF